MCSAQPEGGVGAHCVVEFVGKELTADMNPKEVFLSGRQVPGGVRASGVEVHSHLEHRGVDRLVVPFKEFAVKKHCEVGDARQTRDGFVTRSLQDFYGGGVVWLRLDVVAASLFPSLWLTDVGVSGRRIKLMKAITIQVPL